MKRFKHTIFLLVLLSMVLACISEGPATPKPTLTAAPTPTFTVYDHRDLITYPENYKGAFIKITGKVFNINSDTQLQIYAGENRDAVYIVSSEPFVKIYEDDLVSIIGYVHGEYCGKNVFGGETCMPIIEKATITKTQ